MHFSFINILGYPIKITTSSQQLLQVVTRLYPAIRHYGHANQTSQSIILTLSYHDQATKPLTIPATFVVDSITLQGRSGDTRFSADRNTMLAQALICDQMLLQPYLLRHQVINSVIYFLLCYQQLTPIHCSAFQMENTTLLCLGQSGAGKSTLAMLAYQHGARILGEDIVFLNLEQGKLVAHGDCREIHLLPDAKALFPQLASQPVITTHNGKKKYIISISLDKTMASTDNLSIVYIEAHRSNKYSTLGINNDNKRHHQLLKPTEEGFSLTCRARKKHLEALSNKRSYVLKAGSKLEHIIETLGRLCH